MKHLNTAIVLCLLLTIPATTYAGWFGPDPETVQLRSLLTQQKTQTGDWMMIAGVFAVIGLIAFIIGTMLGSRARKHGNKTKPPE